jgi:hypothetical protein
VYLSTVNLRRGVCTGCLALLIVVVSCGTSSQNNLNNVVVSIAPTTATVASSGQVSLTATVTGLAAAPALTWSIAELQINGASGAQCNWLGSTPPAGPCPAGTIQGADAPSGLTVTYHAPSTSGTFHVTAQWSSLFTPVIVKTATSSITVTP